MSEKKIYKYTLDVEDVQDVPMPAGAKILHVQAVNDQVCVWALVNPDAPVLVRRFHIVGTGHPLHIGKAKFIGTAVTMNGRLVWHVFDAGVTD